METFFSNHLSKMDACAARSWETSKQDKSFYFVANDHL